MTAPRTTILLVEDSPALAHGYRSLLTNLGHDVVHVEDGRSALARLGRAPVDCVLLDLGLPDMDGFDVLVEVGKMGSPPSVVVITGNGSINTAVKAVRAGALDFLVKPFAADRLATTVANAVAMTDLRREVATFRKTVERSEFCDFIGVSLPMQAVYRTIEAAAPSSASVFVSGETGTGKELVAAAIHRLSPRRDKGFVAINCGAIPRDLAESVLFGHVKGAFTGASSDREGAATRADGGTLFLDELGEMEPGLQTKLLRFVQTGEYERVGDSRVRTADIRFVAATNRNPAEAVESGRLREDLFYRLHVVPVHMPPLRERGNDILLLARHFLSAASNRERKRFTGFSQGVEARLLASRWPGNVRQLENLIHRIVVLNEGETVSIDMLPRLPGDDETPLAVVVREPAPAPDAPEPADDASSIEHLAVVERRAIERAIEICKGNVQLASFHLGISASTVYRKKESWQRPEVQP